MSRLDERNKVLQQRADRYARTGETPATDAAKRRAAKKAREVELHPMQKRLNNYHGAWVAAGMPADFPTMDAWEAAKPTGAA